MRLLKKLPLYGIVALYWLGALLVMLFGFQRSTVQFGDQWTAIGILVRDDQFDYLAWEVSALAGKVDQTLYGLHPYMREDDRSQFVREYMNDLSRAQYLESQVSAVYSNPTIVNPEAATLDVRTERDALRANLRGRQGLVEAILEGQVAAVLVDLGFGVGGQLLPPIAMHFTQVPNLLVVSPRDAIRFDVSINLNPMTVDEQTAVEREIDESQNVSSLIVPLGGVALYPSMVLETASIPAAVEVIAHEWLHHYLFAFPLGYNYDFAGAARIINETTANLFGREVGRRVLQRYYPDLVPPPPQQQGDEPAAPLQPPAFDFSAVMNETRLTVDALLAEGRIEDAEVYMDAQREVFVANGYVIRKLNQAFFAFYGGYQSGTPGEGGSDPIGPAVSVIRDASPSIHDWVVTMRGITTREQLLLIRDQAVNAATAPE